MGAFAPIPSASMADIITGYGQQKANLAGTEANLAGTQAATAQTVQQTKGLAQEQAIRQQSLQDADVIRRAYMNTSGDPGDVRDYLLKNGVSGTGFMGWQQHAYDMATKAQSLKAEEIKNEEATHALASSTFDALNQLKDPAQITAAYAQALPRLKKQAPDVPWKAPAEFSAADIPFYQGILGHTKAVLDQAKTVADTKEAESKSAESEANAAKARTQAAHQQKINDLIDLGQKTAQQGANPIDAVFPATLDQQTHDSYSAAYQATSQLPDENGRRPALDAVLAAAAAHAAEYQKATSPVIRQGEASTAAAKATAEIPAHVATAVQTKLAEAKLAPGAVSEIQNPTLQLSVIRDWQRAGDEYHTKEGDASRLQQFVAATRSGNQAAAAIIPLAEVRQIISQRINSQELQMAGGGVSVLRRVENWADSKATGKPSEETLKDIDDLSNLVLNSAKATYRGKVGQLNQLGAKFPTEPTSGLATQGAAQNAITVQDPRGKTHVFRTQADADAFKKAAGIH